MVTSNPQLIGLCGYARSGKNTVGDFLTEQYGYEQRAFADKLRDLAVYIDPYIGDEEVRYSDEAVFNYERAKNEFPEVRRFLVALGKGVREVLGGGIWLDACLPVKFPATFDDDSLLFGWDGPPTVITDVRYPNEAQRILDLGGEVWYLNRLGHYGVNEEEVTSISKILDQGLVSYHLYNTDTVPYLKVRVALLLDRR